MGKLCVAGQMLKLGSPTWFRISDARMSGTVRDGRLAHRARGCGRSPLARPANGDVIDSTCPGQDPLAVSTMSSPAARGWKPRNRTQIVGWVKLYCETVTQPTRASPRFPRRQFRREVGGRVISDRSERGPGRSIAGRESKLSSVFSSSAAWFAAIGLTGCLSLPRRRPPPTKVSDVRRRRSRVRAAIARVLPPQRRGTRHHASALPRRDGAAQAWWRPPSDNEIDDHSARRVLRMRQRFADGVDRAAGTPAASKTEPLGLRAAREHRIHPRRNARRGFAFARVGGKSRIVAPFRMSEHVGDALPVRLIRAADVDIQPSLAPNAW